MSERLDPEDLKDITDRIFSEIVQIVAKYEGFVERIIGDEILVFFGVPHSHEDDPVRAIWAAAEIHALVKTMGLKLEEEVGQPLAMHTGINTGLVVTGKSDVNRGRAGFAGQAINIASRLTKLAKADEIIVGPETYRRTDGFFVFEKLGVRALKGKKEPIPSFRVIAPSSGRTRFEVNIKYGLTPLVGRKRELKLLLDCYAQSKSGQNRAIAIVSEAGVGKSRLLYEFKKRVANENATFLEGKCLSYTKDTAYFPIIDILKANFGIRPDDQDPNIKEKVRRGLRLLKISDTPTLPYLLELLSVKGDDIDTIFMGPAEKKDQIAAALKRITINGSAMRPLIIAVEDLHWIDKSSEECFTEMLKSISGRSVLVIFTFRPEYKSVWGGRSFYDEITLKRLTTADSMALVKNLLGQAELESGLENLIIKKAQGVPFFLEEFVKSLSDQKVIEKKGRKLHLAKGTQSVSLPSTIQGVIMARIDSLHDEAKDLLQRGAVVGTEFSFDLIKQVTGLPEEDLRSRLAVLNELELLYGRKIHRQLTYVFRHALVQEVAYNSLLLKTRKEVHERSGEVIEALYQDRLDEFYEILAHHYSKSKNPEKAFQYLMLSGNKAMLSHFNWEAFQFYKRAIDLLDEVQEGDEKVKKKTQALHRVVLPMTHLGYPENSLQILKAGERLAEGQKNDRDLARFIGLIGNYYTAKGGDPLLGIEYLEKCFFKVKKMQDIELMVPVARGLCGSYIVAGEPAKTVDLAAKVLDIIATTAKGRRYLKGESNIIPVLYALYGHGLGWLGSFADGQHMCDKAQLLISEKTSLYDLGYINFLCGYFYFYQSDGKTAAKHFLKCVRYCEEGETAMWLGLGWTGLGWGYYFRSNLDLAQRHMKIGINIQKESRIPYYISFHHFSLGMVYFEMGDLKRALRYTTNALELAEKYCEIWVTGISQVLLGRILSKTPYLQVEKAENSILEGIKILEKRGIKPWSSIGYYFIGKQHAENGSSKKAFENMNRAYRAFKAMGMEFWMAKALKALQRL
jgi:class 3 adenylate cyclase/tetratricopeptide (TPR) repeat protein